MWLSQCNKCGNNTFQIIDKSVSENGVYILHKVSKCTKCNEENSIISFPRTLDRNTSIPTSLTPVPNEGITWKINEKCLFEGLPPGVYGISCPCPRCSIKC